MQTVVQLEGENKLVTTLKGVKSVTEFNGDTAISVSGHSDSWLLMLGARGQSLLPLTEHPLCPGSFHTLSRIFPPTLNFLNGETEAIIPPGNGRARVPLSWICLTGQQSTVIHYTPLGEASSYCRRGSFVHFLLACDGC